MERCAPSGAIVRTSFLLIFVDAFYNANARHRPLYEDARYFPLFLLGGPLGLTVWQRSVVLIDM